ncbi:hypothetical protein BGZ63DRAFT_379206 [Mariannaea sp. PMI_226]|nr:hypothetical protein BGZ63DRAFT_379206 [Mariannaea sp. PMI_226]
MTSKPAPKPWIHRFNCNIICNSGGTYFDLNSGGGRDPAIHCWNDGSWQHNKNTHWQIFSYPSDKDSRVVIKSQANGGFVASAGHGTRLRCHTGDEYDEEFQWYFEGADLANVNLGTPVRFRSVKHPSVYWDLEGGNSNNGTPFISYNGHGGNNQQFQVRRL